MSRIPDDRRVPDVHNRKMARLYAPDERDHLYPVSAVLRQSARRRRAWWAEGWHGDQGWTPHCVAFSWAHWLADGPRTVSIMPGRRPGVDTTELYCEAQRRDPWPGDCDTPLYEGTSVRAGAKTLQEWGFIKEYRWARSLDEIVQAVLTQGPVVMGTPWYEDMFFPDKDGMIRRGGAWAGGHAYLVNGVDLDRGLARIKNSWGRGWGINSHAYLTLEDLGLLLGSFGEACVPIQQRRT